jgi:glutathione S-transferase
MPLPKLTYFATRGRAEAIRLLLAEAGVEYEEVNFDWIPPPERPPALRALVEEGRLAFNAVPLWEEPDGLRLVQSDAIFRHLARTHGLYGSGPREAALCDMVMEGVKDVRMETMQLISTPAAERPALRARLVESVIPRWLGHFERLLEPSTSGFFVGASLTCADLTVFLMLENMADNRFDTTLAAFPKLAAFKARIAERPRIAARLSSPKRFPAQLLPG